MVERWTTAPEAYDGFSTKTVERGITTDYPHHWRKVTVEPHDLKWQEDRYGSGMHASIDNATYKTWLAKGLIRAAPMPTATMTHEYHSGLKVEFRAYQATWGPWIEHRELRADGTPHNDSWYPISDATWVNLQHNAPEILRGLPPHLAGSSTLTPRG